MAPFFAHLMLAFAISTTTFVSAATPADCKAVNQFLCQVQCGKVLIQCTGVGTGVALAPLDEAAAVCNNGKIDFAQNCKVAGGAGGAGGGGNAGTQTPAKPPVTPPPAAQDPTTDAAGKASTAATGGIAVLDANGNTIIVPLTGN